MTRPLRFPVVALVCLPLLAGPAAAQTSAESLWAEWLANAEARGQTLTFSGRSFADGVLTVRDMASSATLPDAKARISTPETRLVEQADGSVRIEIPEPISIRVTALDKSNAIGFSLAQDGLDFVADGTPELRSYAYNATSLTLTLSEKTLPDDPDAVLEVAMSASDLQSSILFDRAQDRASTNSALGRLDLNAKAGDGPDETVQVTYSISGMSSESFGPMLGGGTLDDPAELFASGASGLLELTHLGSAYSVVSTSTSDPFQMDGTTTGGLFTAGFSPEGFSYGMKALGQKLRVFSPQIPFPVEMSASAIGGDFAMPVQASDEPKPFRGRIDIAGLEVSDGVWNLFDPGTILPRVPATLLVDISGKARLLRNLYDTPTDEEVPGEVTEISLDALTVAAVGAELTGSGAFAVDNTQTGVIPDAPRLIGVLDLALSGADALMQRLTQIGIMTPEDVMGARMMLGMAARPGPTADSLVSKIELTPEGGLIANGMQLQ